MSSKAYFDQVAQEWDTMRTSFFSEDVREKAYAVANVRAGQLAADIGAGSGFIAEGLRQRGLQVIAVDQSEAMLAELGKRMAGIQTRRRASVVYRRGAKEGSSGLRRRQLLRRFERRK